MMNNHYNLKTNQNLFIKRSEFMIDILHFNFCNTLMCNFELQTIFHEY